jgi:hypothetical protein
MAGVSTEQVDYEQEAIELAKLQAIVEYLDDHKLYYKVYRWGSFDYIEVVIHEHIATLRVSKDGCVNFWTGGGGKYAIDEDMMPDSFASATRMCDGSLHLYFDSPR